MDCYRRYCIFSCPYYFRHSSGYTSGYAGPPISLWTGELTLNPLGFLLLCFKPRSCHIWESQVLLTDGQEVFPWVLWFSPIFDERSARYKWNILERAINSQCPFPVLVFRSPRLWLGAYEHLHCWVLAVFSIYIPCLMPVTEVKESCLMEVLRWFSP